MILQVETPPIHFRSLRLQPLRQCLTGIADRWKLAGELVGSGKPNQLCRDVVAVTQYPSNDIHERLTFEMRDHHGLFWTLSALRYRHIETRKLRNLTKDECRIQSGVLDRQKSVPLIGQF